MLTLTAEAIHLGPPDGHRSSAVTCQFAEAGGLIGRSEHCDMVLPDPGQRVSREQARIVYADGRYLIANVSVANPMYVNGMELSPGSHQPLVHGDELRVGTYVIAVVQAVQLVHASVGQPAEPPQTTVLSAQPMQADSAPALADPLGGLGGAEPDGIQSANPFADLLGGSAPIGQDKLTLIPNRQQGDSTAPSSPALLGQTEPAQQSTVTTAAIVTRIEPVSASPVSAPARVAERPPQAEKIPEDFMERIKQGPPVGPTSGPVAATGGLPQNLPTQAHPSRLSLAASGNSNTIPTVGHDQGRAVADGTAWDSRIRDERTPMQQAPLAPPRPPSDGANPSPKTWTPALSDLAGNPFADLMGAPVQTHIARAPAATSASRRTDYIPADFNPFALGGVAQRNTSDPLALLANQGNGFSDVIPQRTLDAAYAPGTESPTALVVNPLEAARESALRVEQSTDPLKLFGGDAHPLDTQQAGNAWTSNAGSLPDHALEMTAYFRPPTAKPDLAMIREQAGDVGGSANENAGQNIVTTPPVVQLPAQPLPQSRVVMPGNPPTSATASSASPVVNIDVVTESQRQSQQIAPESHSPAPIMAAAWEPTETVPPIPIMTTPPMPSSTINDVANGGTQPGNAAEGALMAAFKRGAGLQDWQGPTLTQEWMETMGRMVQAAVQGTISLLAARAAVKQEIHLSVTLINPKDNNPLKFLPDGQTALMQMLGPRIPGFMAPVDAMQEAFDDLITHQTAIAAGTQAALEALFRQFAPSTIESRNPRDGVGEKISGALYNSRLWNAYRNQYEAIKDEVRDDFFRRLGADFNEAYDREYGRNSDSE